MIIIDDRAGSKELLSSACLDGRCVPGRLDFNVDGKEVACGDVMLTGNGPDGSTISVGVELKSVADLLDSISTGRLGATQIPRMLRATHQNGARVYDYVWVLVHGVTRAGADNTLQIKRDRGWRTYHVGRRPVPWSYMEGFLLTARFIAGVNSKQVYDVNEAAAWLVVMDHWLEKPWDKHKGLAVFDKSHEQAAPPGVSPVEEQIAKTAASFQGIDWTRGWAAARHFDSVQEMILADRKEWMEVPGIGPVIAKSVSDAARRTK